MYYDLNRTHTYLLMKTFKKLLIIYLCNSVVHLTVFFFHMYSMFTVSTLKRHDNFPGMKPFAFYQLLS